jgi:hypothetical protein
MWTAYFALASTLLTPPAATADTVPQETLVAAAQKGLSLLEETSPAFIKKGGCNSCHNQMLPAAAQAFARSRGVPTGAPLAQLPPEVSEATTERYVEYSVGGGAGVASLGFDLFASALGNRPATDRIEAEIYFIKGQQQPAGNWQGGADRRPPLVFDDFTPTAFMIFALDRYAPAIEGADTKTRIANARSWLSNAKAERTQEHAFKLLGLSWSNADRKAIDAAVRDLRALQATDGGWSQLPALAPDAYATGMALYAMYVGGVPVSDPAYQAGLKFLLSTQAADGTWHVKTRALPFQPYFESGYPYAHDQWISAAGAAYATMAIAAAIQSEPQRSSRRP